jgi:hypothetical protein
MNMEWEQSTAPRSPLLPTTQGNIGKSISRQDIKEVEEKWTKALKDDEFETRLPVKVDDLFYSIIRAMKKESAAGAVQDFLRDDKKSKEKSDKNGIDHCILWLLLYSAAGATDKCLTTDSPGYLICKMIIEESPYLSFDNQWTQLAPTSGEYKPIKERCSLSGRKRHWKYPDKIKSTPFHRAAERGNAIVIKLMIESVKSIDRNHHDLVLGIMRKADPGSTVNLTALQHAVKARRGKLETLDELLNVPGIINPESPDLAFKMALEDGDDKVVDRFLRQESLRKIFVRSEYIIPALKKMKENEGGDSRMKMDEQNEDAGDEPKEPKDYKAVAQSLVGWVSSPETFDDEILETIIELDLMDVWDKTPESVIVDTSYLLHLAVVHQKLRFVTHFLNKYSGSATLEKALPKTNKRIGDTEKKHYPLWYNNNRWYNSAWVARDGSDDIRNEIRNEIVSSTVEQTSEMQQLSDIFQKSEGK